MKKENGPDRFLAKTKCTALIVEPEFIRNVNDIISKREAACHAIVNALKTMVEIEDGGER